MKCPKDGVLRALIDDELTAAESDILKRHLESCANCSRRGQHLAASAREVRAQLDTLAPNAAGLAIDPALGYGRFRQRFREVREPRPGWVSRAFEARWRRPLWGTLAAACALVLLLSFAPSRTGAQRFLRSLRVEKLAIVPVDLSAFSPDSVDYTRGKLIAQLISDSVVVTLKPAEPVSVATAADASQAAGFKVRALDALGAPQRILVGDQGAFHMTLDRDRIEAVLDQAGRSDVRLPSGIDGATVAVHVPKSVRVLYGACSASDRPPSLPNPAGTAPQAVGSECIDFMQVPTPAVSIPPGLNVTALAEAGLQIAGLTAAEAHAFSQTVDWSSTLVIPIPRNGSSYQTMSVDGVNGTFVQLPARGDFQDRYALIWMKNGMLYSITGKGGSARALSAVQSLN
jgi:anti-sigma factor RsiW